MFLTFIKSPLFRYLLGISLLIGLLYSVYYAGQQSVRKEWDLAKAETKAKVEVVRVQQDKITTLTNTAYVDRIKEVKVKGDTIVKIVPKYITVTEDRNCSIPDSFVSLHNNAILGTVPDAEARNDGDIADVETVADKLPCAAESCN